MLFQTAVNANAEDQKVTKSDILVKIAKTSLVTIIEVKVNTFFLHICTVTIEVENNFGLVQTIQFKSFQTSFASNY